MSTLSYDAQSFILDGQRIWLVSGEVHYSRVPRELWRQRLRAARQAGLNCISTCVFWNIHQSEPGKFVFEGDADLRAFVQMVGEEGLYCILRPGPYVRAEWDFGGLPAWLHRLKDVKLRESSPPFMEACARYIGAVMEQVRDLQATSSPLPVAPGAPTAHPIVMIQIENEWLCHNPEQEDRYLGELARYFRENGCTVPLSMCNNLWARQPGVIDTWNANEHLISDLRQLRVVQPHAPRLVSEFRPGWFDRWGDDHHRKFTPAMNLHRLVQILAAGAQYNLYMFHGGTHFGFFGGRTGEGYVTTSNDHDAPLLEAGGRGEKFDVVKRVSTFANHFGAVLAHLDTSAPHVAAAPADARHSLSIIHHRGSQGQVVYILKDTHDQTRGVELLMPDGTTLDVPLDDERAAWLLLDANLGGTAKLTYSNLRPWAFIGERMLVLFGPPGSAGVVCIDDAPLRVKVPKSRTPAIEHHEQLTVVVLNHEQVDAAYPLADGLVVGAAGLDSNGEAVPRRGWPQTQVIALDGTIKRAAATLAKAPAAPKFTAWQQAGVDDMISGQSPAFREIDGPMSLEALKCDYGYGWYRLTFNKPATGAIVAPGGGDRLHVYQNGKLAALIGYGPGAAWQPQRLKLAGTVSILADNLGRFNDGWRFGEPKGLPEHLHGVTAMRLGKPKVVTGRTPDLFALGGFFQTTRRHDHDFADALIWNLPARGRQSLILEITGLAIGAVIFINDHPVGAYHPQLAPLDGRLALHPGTTPGALHRGRNVLKLALFGKFDARRHKLAGVKLYKADAATAKARWAFAPWVIPPTDTFGSAARNNQQPCWYRTTFETRRADRPLWLHLAGMSKGQIFLNGRNLSRYFVATAAGKRVPPQERYYLPEPWLRAGGLNELMLFDEHGHHPARCRLLYDALGPYGG